MREFTQFPTAYEALESDCFTRDTSAHTSAEMEALIGCRIEGLVHGGILRKAKFYFNDEYSPWVF